MGRRKKKMIYKDRDGKAYKIEGTVVDLSKGSLEDLIGEALDAEADDKIIKNKSKEIKSFIKAHIDDKNRLKCWYELGKKLQFVDSLHLNKEGDRNDAFKRLFKDLKSSPVWNTSDTKAIRYPQHMYTLSKLSKELVFHKGMTWARWFDILEYKSITNNMEILKIVVYKCTTENWNENELRSNLQKINIELSNKNEK